MDPSPSPLCHVSPFPSLWVCQTNGDSTNHLSIKVMIHLTERIFVSVMSECVGHGQGLVGEMNGYSNLPENPCLGIPGSEGVSGAYPGRGNQARQTLLVFRYGNSTIFIAWLFISFFNNFIQLKATAQNDPSMP